MLKYFHSLLSLCVCVVFETCFLKLLACAYVTYVNVCVCVGTGYLIPTPPELHRKSRPAESVCPGANEQLSLVSVLLGFT